MHNTNYSTSINPKSPAYINNRHHTSQPDDAQKAIENKRRAKPMVNITNKLKLFALALTFFSYSLLSINPPSCHAGDKKIHVQGKLTDQSDNPLTNGEYPVTFRLYENAEGGTSLWTYTVNVPVSNGLFHSVLQNGTPSMDSIDFSQTYYLGIQVSSEAEMTPRQLIGAAGYALGSPGDFDIKNDLYVTDKLGIGTPPILVHSWN